MFSGAGGNHHIENDAPGISGKVARVCNLFEFGCLDRWSIGFM